MDLHLQNKVAIVTGAGRGIGLAIAGRRRRMTNVLAGASLMAASAFTRFGIFHAGVQSAADPKYVVEPQRTRKSHSGGYRSVSL